MVAVRARKLDIKVWLVGRYDCGWKFMVIIGRKGRQGPVGEKASE
jgi:hypothetical protein